MVSSSKKLSGTGQRTVSYTESHLVLCSHLQCINSDIIAQTEVIISTEKALEEEKRVRGEIQKRLGSLEDKVNALYGAMFKKDGEAITKELGDISLESKVDVLFNRIKQQQDANDEHKRITKEELDKLKDEKIESLEKQVQKTANYLDWYVQKKEKSSWW